MGREEGVEPGELGEAVWEAKGHKGFCFPAAGASVMQLVRRVGGVTDCRKQLR